MPRSRSAVVLVTVRKNTSAKRSAAANADRNVNSSAGKNVSVSGQATVDTVVIGRCAFAGGRLA
jgi:hypothetical protein